MEETNLNLNGLSQRCPVLILIANFKEMTNRMFHNYLSARPSAKLLKCC